MDQEDRDIGAIEYLDLGDLLLLVSLRIEASMLIELVSDTSTFLQEFLQDLLEWSVAQMSL
jgi:hypothetical protein